jgi:uncharacterized repeat protein (TIGR01451 family)
MKKINYYLALCSWMFILGIFMFTHQSFSQNQPGLLDLRDCGPGCNSNNYTIESVYLSDINGVSLFDLGITTCIPGTPITAYITVSYFTNSGSSTNNSRLFADLKIGDDVQFLNYYFGGLPAANKSPNKVTLTGLPITWTCGSEVRLLSPLVAWTTNVSSDLSESYQCNSYPSAQCQFADDILVDAPLAVQFDYSACTVDGSTTVNFDNTTTGGKSPLSYNWSFGPNASPSTSSEDNPVVVYSGPGSATLTVTDANGISNSFMQSIILPEEIIVTPTVNQPSPGNSDGSISLVVSGGTGTISVSWNDGATGLSRSGLGPGAFQATISDGNGCTKIESFTLIAAVPDISLIKTGVYVDENGDGLQNAGDIINYTFLIANTGDADLIEVTLSDPGITLTGLPFSLGLGESNKTTYSGSYTITQADIENGSFSNTATVTAISGALTVEDEDTFVVNFTQVPQIVVEKKQIGGPNPVDEAGQVIDYEITVENTGNLNISSVVATDFLPGADSGVVLSISSGDVDNDGILNPGELWKFVISYTVTQEDIDLGDNLVNGVNVASTQIPGPTTASAVTPVSQTEGIGFEKTASKTGDVKAGDVITYTYVVTNTGNVTVNGVGVTDDHPGTGL